MKQIQRQQLQQKLSPQQIQLMRLLQLPVTELEQAIKEEVEKNPLLEATPPDEEPLPQVDDHASDWDENPDDEEFEYNFREHLEHDPNETRHEFVVNDSQTAAERLLRQLSLQPIGERQRIIATEIIGSLDESGYLGRDLGLLANDLAFRRGIDASPQEVEEALHTVQSLDPPGVGARNLRECLQLQLERMEPDEGGEALQTALEIVGHHFDNFANHRYADICSALGIDTVRLEQAADIIRHLNPKPAEADGDDTPAYITPDIILTQREGQLQFHLNDNGLPRLSLNSYYTDMLHEMEQQKGSRETLQFLRSKQADAQGFIDLLKQRHDTIVRVMRYIMQHQRKFLLTGDPDMMVPLRQREVADATGLDISTVSRMANSKYIQTDFGTIPLKDCFSKGMATDNGEVSVETIKQRLSDAIANEDKQAPLSDDALAKLLNSQGLPLARRTVAKYREQLGFPVARLRRLAVMILLLAFSAHGAAQMSYYDSLIAVRLEAAVKQEKSTKPLAAPKTSQPANRSKAGRVPPASPTPIAASATPADTSGVSLWYDSFPRHRVNPLGKTQLDMLPDEINLKLVNDTSEFCFPVCNAKTSNYGWRWNRGHHGVDIGLRTGDPVRAAFGGTVRVASRMGGYGNCIVIRHDNGLETLYGHLSKINVKHGQQVKAGEVVGLGGSTGNSTGPHLHFECRFMYQTFDPEWILDFDSHSLRTTQLHLDKSYFGIWKPRSGKDLGYKADGSIIQEGRKRAKSHISTFTTKDF